MDEAWWERSRDPGMMLQYVRGTASARKLRLFACACWRIVTGPVNPLIAVTERLADDRTALLRDVGQHLTKKDRMLLADPWETARDATAWKPETVRRAVQQIRTAPADLPVCWEAWTAAQCEWASLVREIFRCPFRPSQVQESWPLNVVELAGAIYNGEDCGFALHDALAEAGQSELAEHFALAPSPSLAVAAEVATGEPVRRPRWHPKGCWAVDLILGKW